MSLRDWLRGRPAFVADEARWVMLDVETSGLDAARDQLLAIAAIAMEVDWAQPDAAGGAGRQL
jgi:DNA polymerase-3 subunit epsilon